MARTPIDRTKSLARTPVERDHPEGPQGFIVIQLSSTEQRTRAASLYCARLVHGAPSAYPRDNEVFEQLLHTFGVTDTAGWMQTLTELRTRSGSVEIVNPYRGLEPFRESDANVYFGLAALTRQLVKIVDYRVATGAAEPLLVIGASGAGTTSLLRAGLHASLLERTDFSVTYITPSASRGGNLTSELLTTWSAWDATDSNGPPTTQVVIVDQFEELFASTVNESDLAETIDTLAQLCAETRTVVVVGMRAGFFHRAATVPLLLEGLQSDPIVVGPMTVIEATDCIVRPAHQVSITVDPTLLVQLIDEFAHPDDDRFA